MLAMGIRSGHGGHIQEVMPLYMRAGRPQHQKNEPRSTTFQNILESQGSYSPRAQIARPVLRIGVTCTVHRRHLYPASPRLVLRIAFCVADAKNNQLRLEIVASRSMD